MDPILKDEVDQLKLLPTSNNELEERLGRHIPIVKYAELKKFNTIDELLGNNGECIILYETSKIDNQISGHWTCCFRRNDKTISF